MILPGHIALAILGRTLGGVDLPMSIAGTLAPDVVDKSAAHVLAIAPAGRYAMHSLSGWVACTWLVRVVAGKRRARAWAVGHMLHLLGDGQDVPWLWPFRQYTYPPRRGLGDFLTDVLYSDEGRRGLRIELLLLAMSLLALAWERGTRSRRGIRRQRSA